MPNLEMRTVLLSYVIFGFLFGFGAAFGVWLAMVVVELIERAYYRVTGRARHL